MPLIIHMIDFGTEFGTLLFSGDLDEAFVLTKEDGTIVNGLTGILSYQVENPEVENITISNAKKLTLTISTIQLTAKLVTITTAVTLTVRSKQYQPLVNPSDNLNGTMTVQLGEVL